MTHFVGLVVAETEGQIEALVAPFDENTEVAPYDDGEGGTTTYNPKSQWDWWRVGGRWSGVTPDNHCKAREVRSIFAAWAAKNEVEPWIPRTLIDANGWHSPVKMGWWASEGPAAEPEDIEPLLDALGDKRVWVVDFHI